MLARKDRFPHVSVRCIDGSVFDYDDVWQQRHLLLVALAEEGADRLEDEARYLADLSAHEDALQRYDTRMVVTREAIAGMPRPGVLVADRYGEIVTVSTADGAASLPDAADLEDWARLIAHACSL